MPKSNKSPSTLARPTPRDDPPYAHLIQNNIEPSESEVGEIRLIVQDAEKRLAEQANGLQPEGEESEALRAVIETCTKIMHPVRRLPFETITDILHQTLSGPDDWDNYPAVHNYFEGPWAYSEVCRLWRAAMLTYPRLWSDMSVPSNCESDGLHLIGRLKVWLHRSRSNSLRILYGGKGKHGPKEHDAITSLLLEQSKRWEVFRWIGCSDRQRFQRLGEVAGRVPLLRHLDVQYFIEGGPQEATIAVPFADFTVLQPHLVRFHAERFLVDPFKLLKMAPNLEDLVLVLNPAHDDIPRRWLPLRPLTHSGIQRLVINQPYRVALPYLRFPQLKCLGLRSLGFDDLIPVADFIRHSRCPLKKLVVQGKYRFGQWFFQVLQSTPTLEDLILVGDDSMPLYQCKPEDSILEPLTLREGIPGLVPALKTFSCDVTGVDPSVLVAMLESRCERGDLRKVTLWSAQRTVKEWLSAKWLRRVKNLKKRGAQVFVVNVPHSYSSMKMQDLM